MRNEEYVLYGLLATHNFIAMVLAHIRRCKYVYLFHCADAMVVATPPTVV